jgi:hypothetical protein
MRIKTLMIMLSLALFFLATAQSTRAQKDGEAQSVSFDKHDWPTLKFSNKRVDKQGCGLFVGYARTENQEDAFVIRVSHVHARRFFQGVISFPEKGWLYITPSRIIFTVEEGDKSHAFDVPRMGLKDKPVTRFVRTIAGMQINLRERLPTSDTKDQKFAFLVYGDKKCGVGDPDPYTKFLVRTVNDFDGAMAEFKQVTASLQQSGKIEQAPASVMPPGGLAPKVP